MDKPPAEVIAAPGVGSGKRGIVCKLAGAVSRHGRMCLALIAVLTVLVVGMYVYYHGFLRFGPYCKSVARPGPRKGAKKSSDDGESGTAAGKSDRVAEETEKLIETINQS